MFGAANNAARSTNLPYMKSYSSVPFSRNSQQEVPAREAQFLHLALVRCCKHMSEGMAPEMHGHCHATLSYNRFRKFAGDPVPGYGFHVSYLRASHEHRDGRVYPDGIRLDVHPGYPDGCTQNPSLANPRTRTQFLG